MEDKPEPDEVQRFTNWMDGSDIADCEEEADGTYLGRLLPIPVKVENL